MKSIIYQKKDIDLLLSRNINMIVFEIYLEHILFCKYFAAISVASSVQLTLQFYFHSFYSTALNERFSRYENLPIRSNLYKYITLKNSHS